MAYLAAAPVHSLELTSRGVLLARNAVRDSSAPAPADSTASDGEASLVPARGQGVIPKRGTPPSTAMYHSLAISGWGQRDNGKGKKALLFIGAELFCVGGFIYEQVLLNRPGQTVYEQDVIRTNRNTFVIYWLGAKLFGMVDAYVDAQMRDFDVLDITPKGMKAQPAQP